MDKEGFCVQPPSVGCQSFGDALLGTRERAAMPTLVLGALLRAVPPAHRCPPGGLRHRSCCQLVAVVNEALLPLKARLINPLASLSWGQEPGGFVGLLSLLCPPVSKQLRPRPALVVGAGSPFWGWGLGDG